MSDVIGMHFVCRDNANVTDWGDGTFDTGFWKVAAAHCDGLQYVALHQSKDRRSYRHGRVIHWHLEMYDGANRVVFTVLQEGHPRAWVGGGTGEKGFARR